MNSVSHLIRTSAFIMSHTVLMELEIFMFFHIIGGNWWIHVPRQ